MQRHNFGFLMDFIGTAFVLIIALVEVNLPNHEELIRHNDHLPRFMSYPQWEQIDGDWVGFLFNYQMLLLISFLLGCFITIWNRLSLKKIKTLENNLRTELDNTTSLPDEKHLRNIRYKLSKEKRNREIYIEPAVGSFLVTTFVWLALVVIEGKFYFSWSKDIIPLPMLVAQNLQIHGGDLLIALGHSSWHMFLGIISGCIGGILFGFFLSRNQWLKRCTNWHVLIISALPPLILKQLFIKITHDIPVYIIPVFQGDNCSKLAVIMVSWAVFWPVLIATAHTIANINEEYRHSIELLGARGFLEKIIYIEFPWVIKSVLANLRIGIVIGLILLIDAESNGASKEHLLLGDIFNTLADNFNIHVLFAFVIFTSVLVILFELMLLLINKLITHPPCSYNSNALDISNSLDERRKSLQSFEQMRDSKWSNNAPLKAFSCSNNNNVFVMRDISKRYSGILAFQVKNEISMRVGEFISVIGMSGAGKSTFVKLLLGFLDYDEGESEDRQLEIAGINMLSREHNGVRTIGDIVAYVTQHPTLLPHYTVKKNLFFGLNQQLKYAKKNKDDKLSEFYLDYINWLTGATDSASRKKVFAKIDLSKPLWQLIHAFGIADKINNYPFELSGGQAQRVHLLRWLLLARPILVLDEAFSSSDVPLKGMMRDAVLSHTKALGISVINISHDRADVLQISDQIFFIEKNEVLENGTPRQLFFTPNTSELAKFMGHTNLFQVDNINSSSVHISSDLYRAIDYTPTVLLSFEQPLINPTNSILGVLFIPSTDVTIVKIGVDLSTTDITVYKIEAARFTGTQYELNLIRSSDLGVKFYLDAIVQEQSLIQLLPNGLDKNTLQNNHVQVSIVKAILLSGEKK